MPWATAPPVIFSRSAVGSSSGCGCWWLVMLLNSLQEHTPASLGFDGALWPGGGRAGQGAGRVQVGALVDPDPQAFHQLPTGPCGPERQQDRDDPQPQCEAGGDMAVLAAAQ